jgi:hypothetical protein
MERKWQKASPDPQLMLVKSNNHSKKRGTAVVVSI